MDVVSYTVKHSLNYYMRSAYRGNVNALQEDFRGSQPQSVIVSADAKAVQRMTEKLRALNYDSDHETEDPADCAGIRQNLQQPDQFLRGHQ